MSESKFKAKLDDKTIIGSYDGNADGEPSAWVKIHLGEAYEELMQKGEAKVDAVVTFKKEGGKVTMLVDSDKDGEPVGEIGIDVIEGLEEAL